MTIKKIILLILLVFGYLPVGLTQSYYDYELKSIKFFGNIFFSESDLKKNIDSKESPMWFWVFLDSFTPFGDERVYFDSSKISIDKSALIELYRANSYFDIKVEHSLDVDTSEKLVQLNYYITENKSLNFGKVEIIGFEQISEFDRTSIYIQSITIDSTKRYFESEIQSNLSAIRRYLVNNGYLFGRYDSTIVTVDTLRNKADVQIYFTPGDKFTINETVINKTGQSIDQINNSLISEIADLRPGFIYNQSQIERSELRLLKTELFNSLSINPIISDTTNLTVPIEINAAIGSLNDLSPEIKADNEFNSFNLGVGISYTRKNFLGDARKFSVSTSFRLIDIINYDFGSIFKSSQDRDSLYQGVFDINLRMEQPFLFGRPILTTTEFFFRSRTFTESTENTLGGTQKFDFEMPPYTFITFLRPFISVDYAEYDFRNKNLSLGQELFLSVKSFTPGLGIELGSSKTDDILFPTSGSYIFFTPELFHSKTTDNAILTDLNTGIKFSETSTTGKRYFYRIQTGVSDFRQLTNDRLTVFASKIRIGYAQAFTSSNNQDITSEQLIPPNKTFYAGGSNSVRGWKSRELAPANEINYAGYTTETDVIRGGTMWFEGSFEIRKKFLEYFGYALFVDYGNTWNSWREIQINDIAVALGAGIRIYTPIAPFRLDIGTKFYDPADQKMIFKKNFWDNLTFHFGIGEAF